MIVVLDHQPAAQALVVLHRHLVLYGGLHVGVHLVEPHVGVDDHQEIAVTRRQGTIPTIISKHLADGRIHQIEQDMLFREPLAKGAGQPARIDGPDVCL